MRSAVVLLLSFMLTACGGNAPPPTPAPGTGNGQSITGRERLGWDQQAGSQAELASFRFAIYVDGNRSEITAVSCAAAAGAAGFACSGQLPPMSAGTHTLELAAFTGSGSNLVESTRSAPLQVTVTGAAPELSGGEWSSGPAGDTADGIILHAERLLDGFVLATDAAFSPDGRLFIAERPGRITVIRGAPLAASTAVMVDDLPEHGGLLSLALPPDFAQSRMVYVLSAALGPRGALTYRLARYRELAGIMAQRAVLLETPAPTEPSGAMRFGPDGMLYLALGAGGSEPPAGSFMGKVLRLRPDGTLPPDRRTSSPIISSGHTQISGMAWRQPGEWLWTGSPQHHEAAGVIGLGARDGVPTTVEWLLPATEAPSSLAVYTGPVAELHGNLLVASADARHILRVRFAAGDPATIVSTEPLLRDHAGPIRVVVPGPDGAVYFLTDRSLGRIVAQPGPERR